MDTRTLSPPAVEITSGGKSVFVLQPHAEIIVIGAGAFGGWTALQLQQKGYRVTLIDMFGAGNSRSSSGDETRVIRSAYGSNATYFHLNRRALQLWQDYQAQWGKTLLHKTGLLWLCYSEKMPFLEATLPFMQQYGLVYEYISAQEACYRYPLINFSDLHHAVYDAEGGYLMARESCQAVKEAFVQGGGRYIQQQARPMKIENNQLSGIQLSDGTTLCAQAYVWACGAWLGYLFPELLAQIITPTRQEVYYFGPPEQQAAAWEAMPVWIDWHMESDEFFYGIPGNAHRGFKVAYDKRGQVVHPTYLDRQPTADLISKSRQFLAHRFPKMANAPLLEARVCQYENSPDGNFILDQHPLAENCWLLGGGSGHGFKHGPALGELAANILTGAAPLEPLFSLSRLGKQGIYANFC
ncbi:MAG: FAD-dependent oxidoreductase [Cytophagales bacterium]|nr:FAD-dependent oxidoreductase [Bernardetiaceae bacterium]MDW8210054.1 FAD-dependent oxidoreductase [Cytophagales bacterium]